uniref:Uncharacterized protein n=1 Tax=Setaria digitata TaxID=48799 RepID=A0A915PZ78_9BILA
MKRNTTKRSNERRLLRPRLEVKEEEGFDRSDVKKALLESLYEQRKEERRKELEKELKRRENCFKDTFNHKDRKKGKYDYRYFSRNKEQEDSDLKGKEEVVERISRRKNQLRREEKIRSQETEIKEKGKVKSLVKSKEILVKGKEKAKISEVISEQREKTNGIISEEKTATVKVKHNDTKKNLDVETLPSTSDFVRFMSLNYSNG